MRSKQYILTIMALAWLAAVATSARGEEDAAGLARRVKAAFVYNFAQFTTWPAGAEKRPLVIGVVAPDPLGGALERTVIGKTVNGRAIDVRQFRSAADVTACDLLVVAGDEQTCREAMRRAGKAALTVGEGDGFKPAGGIVRFYLEDNKVRFEVSVSALEGSGLQLSSKLLKLAKVER